MGRKFPLPKSGFRKEGATRSVIIGETPRGLMVRFERKLKADDLHTGKLISSPTRTYRAGRRVMTEILMSEESVTLLIALLIERSTEQARKQREAKARELAMTMHDQALRRKKRKRKRG